MMSCDVRGECCGRPMRPPTTSKTTIAPRTHTALVRLCHYYARAIHFSPIYFHRLLCSLHCSPTKMRAAETAPLLAGSATSRKHTERGHGVGIRPPLYIQGHHQATLMTYPRVLGISMFHCLLAINFGYIQTIVSTGTTALAPHTPRQFGPHAHSTRALEMASAAIGGSSSTLWNACLRRIINTCIVQATRFRLALGRDS